MRRKPTTEELAGRLAMPIVRLRRLLEIAREQIKPR
jgi:hypothetical protein